jgi:hypothetical protein
MTQYDADCVRSSNGKADCHSRRTPGKPQDPRGSIVVTEKNETLEETPEPIHVSW